MKFRQLAAFLAFLIGLMPFAKAYDLKCSWMYLDSVDVFSTPQTVSQMKSKIEQYQRLMGFDDLSHKPLQLDMVKLKVRKMNAQQKNELLVLVRSVYNEAKSLKYNQSGPFKTFKRHLDLIVSEVFDARTYFKEATHRNVPLPQILDGYYKKMSELTGSPVTTHGHDVLMLAMRLQSLFLDGTEGTAHRGPLVLYGSLVNGKAYPYSSDLDFVVTDARLEAATKKVDIISEFKEFPISDAQPHVMAPRTLHGLGSLNPLVITIYPQTIIVRVYEKGLSEEFRRRVVPFEDYYF